MALGPWVYYGKIPIYPIFYLLKGEYKSLKLTGVPTWGLYRRCMYGLCKGHVGIVRCLSFSSWAHILHVLPRVLERWIVSMGSAVLGKTRLSPGDIFQLRSKKTL